MDVGTIAEASDSRKTINPVAPSDEEEVNSFISQENNSQGSSTSRAKDTSYPSAGINTEDRENTVTKDAPFTAKKPPPLEVMN